MRKKKISENSSKPELLVALKALSLRVKTLKIEIEFLNKEKQFYIEKTKTVGEKKYQWKKKALLLEEQIAKLKA